MLNGEISLCTSVHKERGPEKPSLALKQELASRECGQPVYRPVWKSVSLSPPFCILYNKKGDLNHTVIHTNTYDCMYFRERAYFRLLFTNDE